jgi:LysR family transcriptional regulator, glycine cleavage system transcriptional activator
MSMPPLRELQVFEAVARHMSFRRAAEDLGVTPTAVSHQIRLLERSCGQPLFVRQPRPLRLTAAGERLFPVVSAALSAISAGLREVSLGVQRHPLRVTATNAFMAKVILPGLSDWNARFPGIAIDIVGTNTVLDIRGGEADVAIRYAPVAPVGVAAVEIARESFVAVAGPAISASARQGFSPECLVRYPLIELTWEPPHPEAPTWAKWQAAAFDGVPDSPPVVPTAMTFQDELHVIEAVLGGHGIGLCSTLLVRDELASGALRNVGDVALPGFAYYFVSRSANPRAHDIGLFHDWLRARLAGTAAEAKPSGAAQGTPA